MQNLYHLQSDLPSPIDEDLEDPTPSPLILVHMDPEELTYLDHFQGGMSEDPETGLREYSRISDLMTIPEIKEIWDKVFSEMMEKGHGEHLAEDIANAHPAPVDPFEFTEGDFNPEGMDLEAAGQIKHPDDTEMALMPLDFANYLDSFRGGDGDRDPVYGLRQYGKKNWFQRLVSKPLTTIVETPQNIIKEGVARPLHQITGIPMTNINEGIRIASTATGYLLGGPLGAGVGTASGNYLTGADPMKSLERGVKVGVAVKGAEMLGGAFGDGFGMQAAEGVPTFVNGVQQAGTVAAGAGPGTVAAQGSSLFGGSNLLPIAGIAALMYKGRQEEEQNQADLEAEHDRKLSEIREREGWSTPFRKINYHGRSLNPRAQSREDMLAGREHQNFVPDPYGQYAEGGSVDHTAQLEPGEEYVTGFKYLDGHTKGQDDKIPINLPQGAWVVDASTTSMLGDGNSKAGASVVKQLSDTLVQKAKTIPNLKIPKGRVPCLLSDGEPSIPPEAVSALGYLANPNAKDPNKKGASIMKKFTEKLRTDKSKNKGGLPPKAKNILHYMPREGRKALNAT